MKVLHVVGARPNFMKIAPIISAIKESTVGCEQRLVHTGQHFDEHMSKVFFDELQLPNPDYHLSVSGGSHARQTARIMLELEPVVQSEAPDCVLVVGDVNSTLAAALVGAKLNLPVAHVEAGLRSGDMTMPEEVNRRVVDAISSLLLTPSTDASENLLREGVDESRIHFVGNVMIDSLVKMIPQAMQSLVLSSLGVEETRYVLATLHRPSNVDQVDNLQSIVEALNNVSTSLPVVFPVHPRTRQRLQEWNLSLSSGVRLLEPQGYLDFLRLLTSAALVITDSGGVQEETTFLGIPCLTLRPNTERPITISQGTNRLVNSQATAILNAYAEFQALPKIRGSIPEKWDGKAGQRIADVLFQHFA